MRKREKGMTTGESLPGSEMVRRLQTVLHAKAKEEPDRRFHALIDKVWREDFLAEAWKRVRRNGGAAGVDGETLRGHRVVWRGALAWGTGAGTEGWDVHTEAGASGAHPEETARQVPALGHPLHTDRVRRHRLWLVLEPIFEADLQPEQYAYRPERSATTR